METDNEVKTDNSIDKNVAILIRQILEREINSKKKLVERLVRDNALDAAARNNAVREGISWALFVLATECGI